MPFLISSCIYLSDFHCICYVPRLCSLTMTFNYLFQNCLVHRDTLYLKENFDMSFVSFLINVLYLLLANFFYRFKKIQLCLKNINQWACSFNCIQPIDSASQDHGCIKSCKKKKTAKSRKLAFDTDYRFPLYINISRSIVSKDLTNISIAISFYRWQRKETHTHT